MNYLSYYILFAGGWAVVNGVLHDIFVLIQRRPYEKELIRLLIDGHLLIFAGILFFISYKGIKNNDVWAYYICISTALFLLGYCALIFKMLPSIGTILINTIALVWLIVELQKIKS